MGAVALQILWTNNDAPYSSLPSRIPKNLSRVLKSWTHLWNRESPSLRTRYRYGQTTLGRGTWPARTPHSKQKSDPLSSPGEDDLKVILENDKVPRWSGRRFQLPGWKQRTRFLPVKYSFAYRMEYYVWPQSPRKLGWSQVLPHRIYRPSDFFGPLKAQCRRSAWKSLQVQSSFDNCEFVGFYDNHVSLHSHCCYRSTTRTLPAMRNGKVASMWSSLAELINPHRAYPAVVIKKHELRFE